MHLTVSFSQAPLMKMSIMVLVIRMPGKLKEGEIPFFWLSEDGRFAPHFVGH